VNGTRRFILAVCVILCLAQNGDSEEGSRLTPSGQMGTAEAGVVPKTAIKQPLADQPKKLKAELAAERQANEQLRRQLSDALEEIENHRSLGEVADVKHNSFDESQDATQNFEQMVKSQPALATNGKRAFLNGFASGLAHCQKQIKGRSKKSAVSTVSSKAAGSRSNGSFDWSQCISEGGAKNCAVCDTSGGALPCSKVSKGVKSTACRDDSMSATLKFWKMNGISKKGACQHFAGPGPMVGSASTAYAFPTLGSNLVLSKGFVTHPNKASKPIGVFIFKRLVTHSCTGKGGACTKGTQVADVYKIGYCVRCNTNVFSDRIGGNKIEDKQVFARDCLPKAFNNVTGTLNKGFECSGNDAKLATASIAGY